jgi:hypothetical protein
MKKIIILLPAIACTFFIACNNQGENKTDQPVVKSKADSLIESIDNDHMVTMGKEDKLDKMQKELQVMIDSIGKLPAKTKTKLAPVRAELDTMMNSLKTAKERMEKWMEEYNMDSAKDNIKERIAYLTSEQSKISSVKETILKGLNRADSLVKKKLQ